ncbi:DUF3152 domain-containing protein [Nocardia sp. NPDC004068]|uniref:DUF3152 domain-containing protein n=1 Tax=Nocardia sp. NPDC004068 TaxID=3364303 RepID=UPI0036AC02AB
MTDQRGSSTGGRDSTQPVDTDAPQPPEIYDPLGLYAADPERSRQPLRALWDPTAEPEAAPSAPRKRGVLRRFVTTYGWRAYALPVLVVLTVLVGVDAVKGGGNAEGGAPGLGRLSQRSANAGIIGAPPKGDVKFSGDLPSGILPDGGPFAETGTGAWHLVPGTGAQVGAGQAHVFTYTVEVEDGVDTTALGGDAAVAKMVEATLANPKSWTHDPRFGFRRVDSGKPDFRVSLTSRQTTKSACGFEIPIDSSCYNSDLDRVVLSEVRWVRGAVAFEGDIGSYRQYQINHEVGHAIGYHEHQPCETDGGLAPVMMQQTFGTRNNDIAALDPQGVVPSDGKKCRFNPWPYPTG